jgi:hypothetical protein
MGACTPSQHNLPLLPRRYQNTCHAPPPTAAQSCLFGHILHLSVYASWCLPAVPQQELLLLLATGACTPPLHNFLSSSLGEAGLRRLARGTDAALSSLHTALLERLVPLAELVLFLLGELRGAVLAAGADSWMGLQVGGGWSHSLDDFVLSEP